MGEKKEPKLTPKQMRFIEEYLIDLNATKAAERAGYSVKTAGATGAENLKKPQIFTEIQKRMKERSEKTGLTAEKIVEQLSKIAMYDVTRGFNIDSETGRLTFADGEEVDGTLIDGLSQTVTEYQAGGEAVEKISTNLKSSDRLKAFELLMKHNNMFAKDRQADAMTSVQVKKIEAEIKLIEARAAAFKKTGDAKSTELMQALFGALGTPSGQYDGG